MILQVIHCNIQKTTWKVNEVSHVRTCNKLILDSNLNYYGIIVNIQKVISSTRMLIFFISNVHFQMWDGWYINLIMNIPTLTRCGNSMACLTHLHHNNCRGWDNMRFVFYLKGIIAQQHNASSMCHKSDYWKLDCRIHRYMYQYVVACHDACFVHIKSILGMQPFKIQTLILYITMSVVYVVLLRFF